MKKQKRLDADLEERALRAQAFLKMIGEGDWTPQDMAAAEVARDMLAHVRELDGVRTAAKWQRKCEILRRHVIGLIERDGTRRYELKRVEDKLAWVYRTEASREEIRAVIEKTIPRRLKREPFGFPATDEPRDSRKPSWSCQFVFYGDDREDALEARIIAALETEGIDFDPLALSVEKLSDNEDSA